MFINKICNSFQENKGIQHFSREYLENTKDAKPEQIIKFLEDFRKLHYGQIKSPSKLISMRVPQNLLKAFKQKAETQNVIYQVKIKELMKKWVDS